MESNSQLLLTITVINLGILMGKIITYSNSMTFMNKTHCFKVVNTIIQPPHTKRTMLKIFVQPDVILYIYFAWSVSGFIDG